MIEELFEVAEMRGYQPQFAQNVFQMCTGKDAKGHYQFSDIARINDMQHTDWSWSALFADYDNDGLKDMFISNGIPTDITNNDYIQFKSQLLKKNLDSTTTKKMLLEYLAGLEDMSFHNYFFRNEGGILFQISLISGSIQSHRAAMERPMPIWTWTVIWI
ncbi:MAG: VCBS repeat-containing protein [Cyclobacteriaceae bacterium]|nr:VCBS repeat-containing protein [Cyclobacteriaceae bacterium]